MKGLTCFIAATICIGLSGCTVNGLRTGMPLFSAPNFGGRQLPTITHFEQEKAMHKISTSRVINAPKDQVWAMMADYHNIHKYVSSVKYSEHVDGPQTGEGTVRRCDVAMGMKLFEEVVEWQEGHSYTVSLRSSMPTRSHVATMTAKEIAPNQTELSMAMKYEMKGGVFGTALNAVMLRPFMTRNLKGMLKEVDAFVTSDELTTSRAAR